MPSDHVFFGCMPALMTPCQSDGSPNIDALVDKGRSLIAAGMKCVIYCGSMGDWPLLLDEQRQQGVAALIDAGVPVIVGTGAQSTARAVSHARHAKETGAKGLMIIPRVLSRGTSPSAQRSHFAAVLEAAVDLPSVIYNSRYYGFETKADLFFDLRREFPHIVGFKEFGGAAALSYAAEHITHKSDDLALVVGVDTQVYHGIIRCGAIGVITGIGNVLPSAVLHLFKLCNQALGGDVAARRYAWELDLALTVLSSFDEGPDLVLYYKHLLMVLGGKEYEHHFNSTDALSDSQKTYANEQLKIFLGWWDAWPGKDH
ncbi:MAG TPA: dihydrodipicolinate synthase family protein [Acidobacteria bacterium]|nr:dihydrodipicolinate synthase family protein [Acidobacteriota bacterium]